MVTTLGIVVLAAVGCVACADKTPEPEGPPIGKHVPRPGEPLPGAFEACGGKSAGTVCTIGHRHGICELPGDGDRRLACETTTTVRER